MDIAIIKNNLLEAESVFSIPYFERQFQSDTQCKNELKLNLWLTVPKGATPVNQTSTTDWQMAAQWDNMISIMPHQVYY